MTIEPEGFLTGIRGGLSRENISARFRAIRKTLGGIPRATVLHYSILSLTLGLAAIIRLLPLRWGAYISEFDPYFNFNDIRTITSQHGIPSVDPRFPPVILEPASLARSSINFSKQLASTSASMMQPYTPQ